MLCVGAGTEIRTQYLLTAPSGPDQYFKCFQIYLILFDDHTITGLLGPVYFSGSRLYDIWIVMVIRKCLFIIIIIIILSINTLLFIYCWAQSHVGRAGRSIHTVRYRSKPIYCTEQIPKHFDILKTKYSSLRVKHTHTHTQKNPSNDTFVIFFLPTFLHFVGMNEWIN